MLRRDQTDFSWSGRRQLRLPGKSLVLPLLLLGSGFWLGRAYYSNQSVEELVFADASSRPAKALPPPGPIAPRAVASAPKAIPPVSEPMLPAEAVSQSPITEYQEANVASQPPPASKPAQSTPSLSAIRLERTRNHKPDVAVKNPANPRALKPERARDYGALRRELLSQRD
jgi:hypothetical protein